MSEGGFPTTSARAQVSLKKTKLSFPPSQFAEWRLISLAYEQVGDGTSNKKKDIGNLRNSILIQQKCDIFRAKSAKGKCENVKASGVRISGWDLVLICI